jgi:spore coat polysaccharide biosynthesis predicted glycosyltransferase SpsG/RimJ/RimL family protein N-acetyltransferase
MPVNAVPGSDDDAAQTADLAWQTGATWVAVDGYQFTSEYQRLLKAAGLGLLFLDDCAHAERYFADFVLNQNLSAWARCYPRREHYTRLLLGTRCALLRPEFASWSGWQRHVPRVASHVLITMGGADPGNTTLKVLEAIQSVPLADLEVRVAVGGSNPNIGALEGWLRSSPFARREGGRERASLLVDAADMPGLMAWADVAVSAAGTTCWELAFMQLPSLVVVLADNQRPNAQALAAAGAAIDLGWHGELMHAKLAKNVTQLLEDQAQRALMAQKARSLVDGEGGKRVAALLRAAAVRVRPAEPSDRELLYQWANDPLTRQMSFGTAQIAWDEHVAWFERVTADPHSGPAIAEAWLDGGWKPVGQVRIEAPDNAGLASGARPSVVSIGLGPKYRGHGLARPVLQAAVGARRAQFPCERLVAHIRPDNAPSLRIFAQVGFALVGSAEVMGQACLRFEYS